MTGDSRPLIITAEFDPVMQHWLEAQRRAFYPAALNRVPAHLTLFHALPGSARAEVAQRLAMVTSALAPLPAKLAGVKSLGRGVAIRIECAALHALRADLAEALWLLLGAQDRVGVDLHVTVQNKASTAEVREAMTSLSPLPAQPACITALRIWRYLDGPWETLGRWPFRGRAG